jgi:hypothetical protein
MAKPRYFRRTVGFGPKPMAIRIYKWDDKGIFCFHEGAWGPAPSALGRITGMSGDADTDEITKAEAMEATGGIE